jgi:hypothetical protein
MLRRPAPAVPVVAALLLGVAVPAAAVAEPAPTVTTLTGGVQVQLRAHDPADVLGLPGDTHLLAIHARSGSIPSVEIGVRNYLCGAIEPPGPPARPRCPRAGDAGQLEARERRLDVLRGRIRLRAVTAAGALDITVAGMHEAGPFTHRRWRRTVGTHREVGHDAAWVYRFPELVTGTFGGRPLVQAQDAGHAASMSVTATTVATMTVPAVPVPVLRPPGTVNGDTVTVGMGWVNWARRLGRGPGGTVDVEAGRVTYVHRHGPVTVLARALRQRCAPGQRLRPVEGPVPDNACRPIGRPLWVSSGNAVVDVRHARLHVVADLPAAGRRPAARLDATWSGRGPLGVREVEDTTDWGRTERSGIRWRHLTASATVGGRPARVWDAGYTVFRQRGGPSIG